MAQREGTQSEAGDDLPPRQVLSPISWRILLPTLLLLILPTGWTQQDDTLDLFLLLALSVTTGLLLWFRRGPPAQFPWLAAPPLLLAAYLIILHATGISGYQPLASILRLLASGTMLVLAFNLFAGSRPRDLVLTLQALVLIMATTYLPITRLELFSDLSDGRYRFTFWQANALGCFLVLSFPFLLVSPWLSKNGRLDRLRAGASIAAALFLASATESRMALILMSGSALILLPWIAHERRGISWKRSAPLTVAGVAILAVLLAITNRDAFNKLVRLTEGQETGRRYMYRAVSSMITDQPVEGLVGHGPGILYEESWDFSVADYNYFGRAKADAFAHNQILDWTLEGGFAGATAFLAFAALILLPIIRGLKGRKGEVDVRLLQGALLLSALSYLVFAQVSIASQFAISLALGALVLAGMLRMLELAPRSCTLPRPAIAALLLIAAGGALLQLPKVMAGRQLALAAEAIKSHDGDPTAGRKSLAKSMKWDTQNVHAWYLRLVINHHEGNSDQVAEAYRTLESLAPNFMGTRLIYAAHLSTRGRLEEALPVLDEYLEVNRYDFVPNAQFLLYAHYLEKPKEVNRGLERLVLAHMDATSAKGSPPPEFIRTTENTSWIISWPNKEPITMTLAEIHQELFKGLKGNPGHDYPLVIRNARQLMKRFGFDARTLEKGSLKQ